MDKDQVSQLARQAIAALPYPVGAYSARDNGDGTITLWLYGHHDPVIWPNVPPSTAGATPTPETTLPVQPQAGRVLRADPPTPEKSQESGSDGTQPPPEKSRGANRKRKKGTT